MVQPSRGPAKNLLLAALPAAECQHLLARCEQVRLKRADTLYLPGEPIRHVFFPTEAFISVIIPVEGHQGLEIGLVGSEGMLGVSLTLGVEVSRLHAVVQGAGLAWRMGAVPFTRELKRSRMLQRGVNRYLHVTLTQLAQTAACTRFHVVQARLARWLLMSRDRAHSNRFHVTHEFLAHLLGVRRSGITQAARSLQKLKLIRYKRGDLQIIDHGGLERAACNCYAIDMGTYAGVLS